jgi:hypothetical protein
VAPELHSLAAWCVASTQAGEQLNTTYAGIGRRTERLHLVRALWSTALCFSHGALTVAECVQGRMRFMEQAAATGLNCMSLDSDILLTQSPYLQLKVGSRRVPARLPRGVSLPATERVRGCAGQAERANLFVPEEGDGSNVGFMYMQRAAPGGAVHFVFSETVRLIRAGLARGKTSKIFNQDLFSAALMTSALRRYRCVCVGEQRTAVDGAPLDVAELLRRNPNPTSTRGSRYRHYEGWHQRWYEEHEHGQMSQLLNAGPLELHGMWGDALLDEGPPVRRQPVRAHPSAHVPT